MVEQRIETVDLIYDKPLQLGIQLKQLPCDMLKEASIAPQACHVQQGY